MSDLVCDLTSISIVIYNHEYVRTLCLHVRFMGAAVAPFPVHVSEYSHVLCEQHPCPLLLSVSVNHVRFQ